MEYFHRKKSFIMAAIKHGHMRFSSHFKFSLEQHGAPRYYPFH